MLEPLLRIIVLDPVLLRLLPLTTPLKVKLLVPPMSPPPNTMAFATLASEAFAWSVPAFKASEPVPMEAILPRLKIPAESVVPPS